MSLGLVGGVYLWVNKFIDGPRPAMIDERRSSTIDPEGRMSALAVNGKMYVGSSINRRFPVGSLLRATLSVRTQGAHRA